jgi:hypothetical protein
MSTDSDSTDNPRRFQAVRYGGALAAANTRAVRSAYELTGPTGQPGAHTDRTRRLCSRGSVASPRR